MSWVPAAGTTSADAMALRPELVDGWRALVDSAGPVPPEAAELALVLGDDPHAVTDADVAVLVDALGPERAVRALVAAAMADGVQRFSTLLEVDP